MKTIQRDAVNIRQRKEKDSEQPLHLADMYTVLSRLTHVLAQETTLLRQMKVSPIEKLQEEKISLTTTLENYKSFLQKTPAAIDTLSDEKRSELRRLIEIFELTLEENHLELMKVRAVNMKVVEAVTVALSDHLKRQSSYGNDAVIHTEDMATPPMAFSQEI